jgi:hypothetical protein
MRHVLGVCLATLLLCCPSLGEEAMGRPNSGTTADNCSPQPICRANYPTVKPSASGPILNNGNNNSNTLRNGTVIFNVDPNRSRDYNNQYKGNILFGR